MVRSRYCVRCGKTFETDDIIQMFCSEECEELESKFFEVKKEVNCVVCGKAFTPASINQCYCSRECCKIQTSLNQKKRSLKNKNKPKVNSIAEMTIEARKHGMTYGKYVAMLEIEKQRHMK